MGLFLANILLGIIQESPPLVSSYNYKLSEIFFDFDKFLGDFWMSIILSCSIAGYFISYS